MRKSFITPVYYVLALLGCSMLFFSCKKEGSSKPEVPSATASNSTGTKTGIPDLISVSQMPADISATKETIHLFQFLYGIRNHNILFGHQDELIVGSNHYKYKGGSDTYDMIQDYPALYGYDLGNLEQNELNNRANISFDSIRTKVKQIYQKGGISTLNWAVDNPVDPSQGHKGTGVENTISKLFANQAYLNRFNTWLDRLSVFFKSLKTDDGTLIPIIFRPFHECNGTWFWWGKRDNTPEDYIKLYRYTVDYLKGRGVHNLLYAYCTGRFKSEEKYFERYPGDEYVDILSIDVYDKKSYYPDNPIADEFKQMCEALTTYAQDREKVCAVAETGMQGMPVQDWWTSTLYNAIQNSGVSYVMVWGNYGKSSTAYYGTFKGQLSESNFKTFSSYGKITFMSSLSNPLVYE